MVGLRWVRFGGFSFFKNTIHLTRFFLMYTLLPGLNLTHLASWLLGLGLVHSALSGAMEEIRESARAARSSVLPSPLKTVRQWNRRMIGVIALSGVPLLIWVLQPAFSSQRIFSIYDLIRTISVIRMMSAIGWLPESAYIQGISRSHTSSFRLFFTEMACFLGLPVLILVFGPWGLAFHFGYEFLIKEAVRIDLFFRTRRNLGMTHRLFRWPAPKDAGELRSRFHWGWIGLAIMTRLESWILPLIWKAGLGAGLVFYIPLIRSLMDYGTVFRFDVLRNRRRIDRWIPRIVTSRAAVLGLPFWMLVMGYLMVSSRLLFEYPIDQEEGAILFAAYVLGTLSFIVLKKVASRIRNAPEENPVLLRCRFVRGPETNELKQAILHRPERFGALESRSLGRNGILIVTRDSEAMLERIRKLAPGLLQDWQEASAHRPDPSWREIEKLTEGLACPNSEAKPVLHENAALISMMIEQGDNGRPSADRKWRFFFWRRNSADTPRIQVVLRDRLQAHPRGVEILRVARSAALAEVMRQEL
ncbi:MAG: hypothetical protein KGP28_05895 [Bdellovibrionales bacterium]|nr:hypothetical protein [Bdellovibrionales bacterium]